MLLTIQSIIVSKANSYYRPVEALLWRFCHPCPGHIVGKQLKGKRKIREELTELNLIAKIYFESTTKKKKSDRGLTLEFTGPTVDRFRHTGIFGTFFVRRPEVGQDPHKGVEVHRFLSERDILLRREPTYIPKVQGTWTFYLKNKNKWCTESTEVE